MTKRVIYECYILEALQHEWRTCCNFYLSSSEYDCLTLPIFILDKSTTTWGKWVGGRICELRISWQLVKDYSWDCVCEVLRHEMAHQIVDQCWKRSNTESAHGPSFAKACKLLRIPAMASYCPLEKRINDIHSVNKDGYLNKIDKLLALANSDNIHEAEAAASKAYQLSVKYNKDNIRIDKERQFFSKTLGEVLLKRPIYIKTLVFLLSKFYFVECIWISQVRLSDGRLGMILEISGSAENVLMAEYVYHFVLNFIAQQWWHLQKKRNTRRSSRTAYASGVIDGFYSRLEESKKQYMDKDCELRSLVTMKDAKLDDYYHNRHISIKSTRNRGRSYTEEPAFHHGKKAGKGMVINKGIHGKKGNKANYLT